MSDLLRHLEVEATSETTLGFQKSYLALLEQTLPTGKARLHRESTRRSRRSTPIPKSTRRCSPATCAKARG